MEGAGGVLSFNPIYPGRGVKLSPPYRFFAITQKVIELGSSNTRLNLYLDQLPVFGYQHFIALWKAYNKSNQIAQFLRNFAQIFAQTPFQGI